jgi:replicative DNA helicase
MTWSVPPFLRPAFDPDEVQAAVLRAALGGDAACLARLPGLLPALDEPYRAAADELLRLRRQQPFVDHNVLGGALARRRLVHTTAEGRREELTAGQVMALIGNTAAPPGQAEAYLALLADERERRRRREQQAWVEDAVARHAADPRLLAQELLRAADRAAGAGAADRHPSELRELIPYARFLQEQQSGAPFQGLDSGFEHLNNLCNGLDTGLFVVAARPGEGKTTLVWQMCGQAAARNSVPVLFISFEQSKRELRAKALARLGGLPYRHVLRGRLRAGDPDEWAALLGALDAYAAVAPRLTVVEADDGTTVEVIRELVADQVARAGAARCLVAIDYLQAIPLAETDAGRVTSTKDRVDLHVSALRRLARDLNVSVLCISSENRAGYKSKALDVFKESGGIEYGADLAAVLTRDKGAAGAAPDEWRGQALNVVKHRNGECGVIKFRFYTKRAEFVETAREELPADDEV